MFFSPKVLFFKSSDGMLVEVVVVVYINAGCVEFEVVL